VSTRRWSPRSTAADCERAADEARRRSPAAGGGGRSPAWLLIPSAALLPVLAVYVRSGGTPHFFVHVFMGWDVALVLLLAATLYGTRPRRGQARSRGPRWSFRLRRDGLLPLALALYALFPDFIYTLGPAHRDWMDVFLFHIALDEILPVAVPALAALCVPLVLAYVRFRKSPPDPEPGLAAGPAGAERRRLGVALGVAGAGLAAVVAAGIVVERSARTPLVRVGQEAPGFSLPSTQGGVESLAAARGRPVVLAFVPSVRCGFCRAQLQALQEALPALRARGAAVFVVSTDTRPIQQRVADQLGLEYPILSEAPTVDQHPVGSAYGLYHLPQRHRGPVDANAVVVIDAAGIVRSVRVQPSEAMAAAEILALAEAALDATGSARAPRALAP
jgi:peroxiredoxin